MSLMTQRGHNGHRGLLSDYLWFYLHLWITWLLSGHHCTQWILFVFMVVNEPTCDSEVYLHLCVADISIWTACDVYCELSLMDVMFIWMWYVAVTEPNKLIICGSFAECNTRQRGLLPSSRVKTLGKCTRGKILCILGLKWLLCRVSALWNSAKKPKFHAFWDVFAECVECDTRQRWKLCRVPGLWHTAKE